MKANMKEVKRNSKTKSPRDSDDLGTLNLGHSSDLLSNMPAGLSSPTSTGTLTRISNKARTSLDRE